MAHCGSGGGGVGGQVVGVALLAVASQLLAVATGAPCQQHGLVNMWAAKLRSRLKLDPDSWSLTETS